MVKKATPNKWQVESKFKPGAKCYAVLIQVSPFSLLVGVHKCAVRDVKATIDNDQIITGYHLDEVKHIKILKADKAGGELPTMLRSMEGLLLASIDIQPRLVHMTTRKAEALKFAKDIVASYPDSDLPEEYIEITKL